MQTYNLYKDGMPWTSFQAEDLTNATEKVLKDFANKKLTLTEQGTNLSTFATPNGHEYQLCRSS